MKLSSNRGFSLVAVLVAAVFVGIMALVMSSKIGLFNRAEHNLSARVEASEISALLGMIFDDPQICATSGLLDGGGFPLDPATFPAPNYTGTSGAVTLKLPDGTILAKEGDLTLKYLRVDSLRFTELKPLTGTNYTATLTLKASLRTGKSFTTLKPREFLVSLGILSEKINSCEGLPKIPTATTCPPGKAIASINTQLVPTCSPRLVQTPDFESNWVAIGPTGTATITHNLNTMDYFVSTEWKKDIASDPEPSFRIYLNDASNKKFLWANDGHVTDWYEAAGITSNKQANTIDLTSAGYHINKNVNESYKIPPTTLGKVRIYKFSSAP